ncbi:synaptic vesicle glycoprotein 2C isoform X3 [Callorhinchus milii]|uniref:synaptic vesicle glycoprotein 2C isoform X3 n=1 Tax=Callorhinchus milii TaxID=7868 RepID=UPI0004574E0D|nr:synaptic vesicle glycoprotein 2C isoform X3 [Callorhinchus milii]|eukprot:gi/632979102/ref/XP_007906281.1/ PREDICTED: synaptic vesicle glycoprotein 2C-like isoform X3 [Callorhinchus milii]
MEPRDREPLLRGLRAEETDSEGEVIFEQTKVSKTDLRRHVFTYEEAVEEAGFGCYHLMLLLVCGWANASDAVEILCVSFLLPTARCDLHLNTTDMGWLTASIFLGMMIGGYMWGALADLKGRRSVLLFSLTINGVFGALSSLASHFWLFLLLRFLSGIGVGGSIPVIFSYFTEFQPRNKRGTMISALATFWMAGNILTAGLAWLVIPSTSLSFQLSWLQFRSWRLFVMLCSIPSLSSAFIYAVGMPESPRYLMEAGRGDEAIRVFRRMFYWNQQGRNRTFSVARLKTPPTEDSKTYFGNTAGQRLQHQLLKGLDPIRKIFSSPLRSRTIPLALIFFSISFGYYGLWMWFPELFRRIEMGGGSPCITNMSQSSSGNVNISCYPVNTAVYKEGFITAAANLPGNILTILVMDLVGGKLLLLPSPLLPGTLLMS